MFTRAVSTKVIYALTLAMLLAWVGHTFALLLGVAADPSTVVAGETGHGHSHDVGPATACVLCVDHQHPPMTPDHVHETPYLGAVVDLQELHPAEQSFISSRHRLPDKPIDLIERPPRSRFVL